MFWLGKVSFNKNKVLLSRELFPNNGIYNSTKSAICWVKWGCCYKLKELQSIGSLKMRTAIFVKYIVIDIHVFMWVINFIIWGIVFTIWFVGTYRYIFSEIMGIWLFPIYVGIMYVFMYLGQFFVRDSVYRFPRYLFGYITVWDIVIVIQCICVGTWFSQIILIGSQCY